LGTVLGCAFGFQACRLVAYLSGGSLSGYELAWIFASHALLGPAIAATAGRASWWQRGLPLGLLLAAPGAAFLYATGRGSLGASLAIAQPLAGLLIALLVDFARPAARPAARTHSADGSRHEPSAADIRHRLREGHTELQRLDDERRRTGNPRLGRTVEDRIVWGELLELELQDIDERVGRMDGTEGGAGGPRRGEPHEPDHG
jgi:hypothetical protein